MESATRIWGCGEGCQLFVVAVVEEEMLGRIFLGRVDQVETELELAESQATSKASSCGGEAPTHRAHPAKAAPWKRHWVTPHTTCFCSLVTFRPSYNRPVLIIPSKLPK